MITASVTHAGFCWRRPVALLAGLLAVGPALAALTMTPITWNVVGLDSNNPPAGPRHFPVGTRVCSSNATTNVAVNWQWDSANTSINLRPGSLSSITIPSLAANACADAYFEVEVTQNVAAFDTARRYHISASDGSGTTSTPTPRELYVEHLVSQARNGVADVKLDGASIPPGGTMKLIVGGIYNITLVGATATQGYNQLQSFIDFPNTIFRVLAVNTTYSADTSNFVSSPNDRLYADACGWANNFASPNYRSCVGDPAAGGAGSDGKAGGAVSTTYTVQILVAGAGTTQTLNTLIYDFSGSSYHYNGDYAVGARFAQIFNPVPPTFGIAFAPSTVPAGGKSVLSFTIGNANSAALANVAFTDTLPTLTTPLTIAASPAPVISGCGAGVLAANVGASAISLTGATIAANGTCTISVAVNAPAVPTAGTYVNTTGPLSVNGSATALTATANLNVTTAPVPAPGTCLPANRVDLARWTMDAAQGTTTPPAPSFVRAGVLAANASFAAASGASNAINAAGNPANGWSGTGWPDLTLPTATGASYFQFTVDTSQYHGVGISLDVNPLVPGNWGNASNNNIHVWAQADSGGFAIATGFPVAVSKNTWTANLVGTAPATGTSTTNFRVNTNGANKVGAELGIDNVRITGCATPVPPTITKAFSPNPIAVNGTSTLTFALHNPNASALSGVKFLDSLPSGLQVASPVSAVTTCGGSPTWAPLAGATTLAFGQSTGATIPGSSACTVTVNVTAASVGTKLNISDFISATESGANTTATGSATATLNVNPVILPPVASKSFSPSTIAAGQMSILHVTIVNPNSAQTLTSVELVDTYGGDLVNGSPLVPPVVNTCGGTLSATSGGGGFTIIGVTLAPGASCSIEIPVTASTNGAKANTTDAVQSVEGGPGNQATATLSVVDAAPAISLSKKVRISPSGPWLDAAVVSPGTGVDYQFIVENVGNVPFSSFSVSDPLLAAAGADPAGCAWQTSNVPSMLPALPVASATLDPTATCVRGPVNAVAGIVQNVAAASGVYDAGNYTTTNDANYVGADPNLSLTKEISTTPTGPWSASIPTIAPGSNVYYRLTIANNGAQSVTGLSINDPMVSTASCSYVDPLPPASASVCVVGPVTTTGAPGATITNTATVQGTSGGSPVSDTGQASYTLTAVSADVSIVKTLTTPAPHVPGQSVTYTLVVANVGPDAAVDVQVTDTPTNLAITDVSGGGCSTLPCTIPSLAAGATATITVTATISASGAFDNVASANATTADPNPGNNTDSAGNGGVASVIADIDVSKTNGTSSVLAGGTTTYTIVVTNTGPGAVSGATVTDTLPAAIASAAWTCVGTGGGTCTASGSGNIADTINLPAGASATYTLVATVSGSASGTLVNTATASVPGGVTDSNPSNNVATDTDTITPAPVVADLAIAKTDGRTTVNAGGSTTYTLTVTNRGPGEVSGATVSDTAPPGMTFGTWTCAVTSPGSGGSVATECGSVSGNGNVGTTIAMKAGAVITFTVPATVSAAAGATLLNVATVAVPVGVTDSNPANDSASDTDAVVAAAIVADLAVTKTNGVDSVTAGGATSYTITVANAGPDPVTGAIVADPAVAGLAKATVTCSATPDQCATPPTVAQLEDGTFALPALAAGSTYQIVVGANVTAAAGGSVANVATIAPPTGVSDPNPANNSATDSDAVATTPPLPDLVVAKSHAGNFTQGQAGATYTLVVSNAGAGPTTTPVSIADTLPTALTATSITGTGWSCTLASLSCTRNDPLAAGASYPPIALTVNVAANAPGSVVNTATVIGGGQTASANDTASDTTTIVAPASPDLALTKNPVGAARPGANGATWLIVVTNAGTGPTSGAVNVVDTLPIGFSVASLSGSGWACTAATVSCTRSDPLPVSASYPGITIVANVPPSAAGTVANIATVSGGGDASPANNSATSAIAINAPAPTEIPTLDPTALVALVLAIALAGWHARRPAIQ